MSMRISPAAVVAAAAVVAVTAIAHAALGANAAPPGAAGTLPVDQNASVVGQAACAECHDTVVAQFNRSAHGQLPEHARSGQPGGCESCHGPGSVHAASGAVADIRSFKALDAREASRACLTCHQREQAMEWPMSEHAMGDVSCTSCHRIHQSREVVPGLMGSEGKPPAHATAPAPKGSLAKSEPELCFSCHKELRAKFSASSHHPVREGRITCSGCHNVHGTGEEHMLRTDEGPNGLCYTCHAAKQGPFVFEHAPVEESCMTCHDPHGTVANNLLKQGEPFLCLQCHEMHFHNARVTPTSPFVMPSGGSTNPNGPTGFQRAFGTRCTTCHTKIHGSDNPSQGVSGGGKALIR